MAGDASEIYTASITNLAALCTLLETVQRDLVLICSGTDRRVSLEDCICAGLVAQRLRISHEADDSALLMCHAAEGAIERCGGLEGAIASSFHAKRLIDLGFAEDLHFASRVRACGCVPMFDPATGEIRPAVMPDASPA
jgi:2-phosphosulfolactate phosphatase